jgi:GPI ethanolamine phosphate transferase 3 subunit O
MVLNRISYSSTLCRPESRNVCTPTFYAYPDSSISSPQSVLFLLMMTCLSIVTIREKLKKSNSFHSAGEFIGGIYIPIGLCITLLYWIISTVEEYGLFKGELAFLSTIKLWFARLGFPTIISVCIYNWFSYPTCLGLEPLPSSQKSSRLQKEPQYVLLGFENAMGATYFLFLAILYMILGIVQKPMGGLMIGFEFLQIICLIELNSTWRDEAYRVTSSSSSTRQSLTVKSEKSSSSRVETDTSWTMLFVHAVAMYITGHRYFFATGHQTLTSTMPMTIPFIGFQEANWIIGPIMMVLNVFGAQFLACMALPLLVIWKRLLLSSNEKKILKEFKFVRMLGLFFWVLTSFVAVAFVGHFKRHLMVWSVFFWKGVYAFLGFTIISVMYGVLSTLIFERSLHMYKKIIKKIK